MDLTFWTVQERGRFFAHRMGKDGQNHKAGKGGGGLPLVGLPKGNQPGKVGSGGYNWDRQEDRAGGVGKRNRLAKFLTYTLGAYMSRDAEFPGRR